MRSSVLLLLGRGGGRKSCGPDALAPGLCRTRPRGDNGLYVLPRAKNLQRLHGGQQPRGRTPSRSGGAGTAVLGLEIW
jgi:hypothetical protein